MQDNGLYSRQRDIPNICVPERVAIVGLGGIGSWVAVHLALAGCTDMILIDDDVVEESNLNRTLFKATHVGIPKVDAVADLIGERRVKCVVYPFQCRTDTAPQYVKDLANGYPLIDCRDSLSDLRRDGFINPCHITGGYDGSAVTIHINPEFEEVFGIGDVRYRITPSYFAPPSLISTVIVDYMCKPDLFVIEEEVISFSMDDVVEILKRGSKTMER